MLHFISDYEPILKQHLESNSVFKGISKTIQNNILEENFLAVMTEETTVVSNKSQVVLVFRSARNGKPVERFWEFFNPANLTAATLSAIVIDQLEPLIGSYSEKLIAQTYDDAAVLSGVNSRVQTR